MEDAGKRTWPPRVEVIDDRTAEILRGMTPAERLWRANEMYLQTRAMVRSAIRSQHPGWSEAEVETEWRTRLHLWDHETSSF